jgi:hypothetical protein
MIMPNAFDIFAEDVTGQKTFTARRVPADSTVGDMLDGLVPRMQLPRKDSGGQPLAYHARLEREGRHLHRSEIVGDALKPSDRVVIQPEINAGSGLR